MKKRAIFVEYGALLCQNAGFCSARRECFGSGGAEGAEKRDGKTRRGAKSVIFAPQKPIGCEVSEIRTWSVRKEILPLPYGRPRSQTQGSGAGSERTARSSPFMVTDYAPPPCAQRAAAASGMARRLRRNVPPTRTS